MEVWPQLIHLTFSKTQHPEQTLWPAPVYLVEKHKRWGPRDVG